MVFSDPFFLFYFLPLALLVTLILPRRFFASSLLIISLIFYFWSSGSIVFVLIFSMLFNWALALILQKHRKRWILGGGVCVNILILLYFKYAIFFAAQSDAIFGGNLSGTFRNVILPIGISFFTFQAVSYLIDVWRKDVAAEPNPIVFGAYLSFFPQLIAGPIVRFSDAIQYYRKPDITTENISAGAARFAHGLAKKVLIADSAGAIADACFASAGGDMSSGAAWLGALAYTIQIYFDFSGYSDMAIGLGLLLGIRFNENFERPYSSSTVTEFWRRWHISLSTWFRDYLYIPLGGNRGGSFATYRNLMIVFAVTGFWHGAAWTFMIWGLYHGLFLIGERLILGREAAKRTSLLMRAAYLLPVTIIGWVIFRADTLPQAFQIIGRMFDPRGFGLPLPVEVTQTLDPWTVLMLAVGCLIFILPRQPSIGRWLEGNTLTRAKFGPVITARLAYSTAGLLIACTFALSSDFSPFLYFRF